MVDLHFRFVDLLKVSFEFVWLKTCRCSKCPKIKISIWEVIQDTKESVVHDEYILLFSGHKT